MSNLICVIKLVARSRVSKKPTEAGVERIHKLYRSCSPVLCVKEGSKGGAISSSTTTTSVCVTVVRKAPVSSVLKKTPPLSPPKSVFVSSCLLHDCFGMIDFSGCSNSDRFSLTKSTFWLLISNLGIIITV